MPVASWTNGLEDIIGSEIVTDFGIKGKNILITGGTGSFGKKCVEALIRKGPPDRLVVFSRDELKQYEMSQQINHPAIRFFIGDVRDKERLYRAMDGVDAVIHAAALKQVPACEYNPFEAVKTNIIGAVNVIDAAIDRGVKRVIAVSTDKAVSPINLYGATKLCAEKLFVQGNIYSGYNPTIFSCARYGNVFASRGSVVQLFMHQKSTGVITITDRRMTRFWITLDQGVDFVIRSLQNMQGGEIFIPKIPSMSVTDLAEALAPGCDIKITGIRPGEKIHELLVSPDESRNTLEFPDMFIVKPPENVINWKNPKGNEGKELPDGFSYGSDNNTDWLTVAQIRDMVG